MRKVLFSLLFPLAAIATGCGKGGTDSDDPATMLGGPESKIKPEDFRVEKMFTVRAPEGFKRFGPGFEGPKGYDKSWNLNFNHPPYAGSMTIQVVKNSQPKTKETPDEVLKPLETKPFGNGAVKDLVSRRFMYQDQSPALDVGGVLSMDNSRFRKLFIVDNDRFVVLTAGGNEKFITSMYVDAFFSTFKLLPDS